ncbi:MAG: hypothetical protein KME23_24315 [Goleter apudmare HA4340-LM2]|nr:hypothetical protein [Goleter apudmare HA4340-LM2]
MITVISLPISDRLGSEKPGFFIGSQHEKPGFFIAISRKYRFSAQETQRETGFLYSYLTKISVLSTRNPARNRVSL